MNKLADQIGTFAIVTVVTVLVWLYAEDANIVEYTDQPVRLQFVVPEDETGQVSPGGPITVRIDFDGSNGQYQQFIDETREKAIKVPLPLTLAEDYQSADVDMRSLIEEIDELRKLGINIQDVSPATQVVSFEKNVDVSLGVAIIDSNGIELAEPAELSNAQPIVVRGLPAGRRSELDGVKPVVMLTAADVAGLPKGERRPVRLPVHLSKDIEDVTPTPATVDVLVRLANDIDRVTLDRLTVLVSYPPSINKRYLVELDESSGFLTAFELEGPREQIAKIKADSSNTLVRASVWLTNAEVDEAAANNGQLTKAVEIIAPAGVVPVSVAERVTIRVTPRPTPPAP